MSNEPKAPEIEPPPVTDDELALIVAAHEAATPGPWFTVEAPWRQNYRDPETGTYEAIPTYVIAGSDDPHHGKPVIDAVHIDEWETNEERDAFVSQTDSDLGFCCIARSAIPRLVREVVRLRAEAADPAKPAPEPAKPELREDELVVSRPEHCRECRRLVGVGETARFDVDGEITCMDCTNKEAP